MTPKMKSIFVHIGKWYKKGTSNHRCALSINLNEDFEDGEYIFLNMG